MAIEIFQKNYKLEEEEMNIPTFKESEFLDSRGELGVQNQSLDSDNVDIMSNSESNGIS